MRGDILLDWFKRFRSVCVAFSGGLDSSVIAMAARISLGKENVAAITADGPSSPFGELEDAKRTAEHIGIRHFVLPTREMDDPRYLQNDRERCYYCKSIRLGDVKEFARSLGIETLLEGSNIDDANDFRPGSRSVQEHGFLSPLKELGIDKVTVRGLASEWNLPNRDKPAEPCLSTRIAYGEPITPETLRRIDEAERFLKSFAFTPVRVRVHTGNLCRIEVPSDQIGRIMEPEIRGLIVRKLKELHFVHISFDLEGFRSGNMNRE